MEDIVRNVRDIGATDRQALEHVIGQPLSDDQQVVIHVVGANGPAKVLPTEKSLPAQAEATLKAWREVYAGLSEAEIERLDAAIRQRANLTRYVD